MEREGETKRQFCQHRIFSGGRDVGGHLCTRKAAHGSKYCTVHARRYEKGEASLSVWKTQTLFLQEDELLPEEVKVRSIGGKTFVNDHGRMMKFSSRYGRYFLTELEAFLATVEVVESRLRSARDEVVELERRLRSARDEVVELERWLKKLNQHRAAIERRKG